jgi:hypothetical protein
VDSAWLGLAGVVLGVIGVAVGAWLISLYETRRIARREAMRAAEQANHPTH